MNQELINILPHLSLIQNPEDINESTALDRDLKLFGFEAQGFIYRYSEVFDVDVSQFRYNKYLSKETGIERICRRYFGKNKNTLTMGQLARAIDYKRLNDVVLQKIAEEKTEKPPRKKIRFITDVYFSPMRTVKYTLLIVTLSLILGAIAYVV